MTMNLVLSITPRYTPLNLELTHTFGGRSSNFRGREGQFGRGRGRGGRYGGRYSIQCQICYRVGHEADVCYYRYAPGQFYPSFGPPHFAPEQNTCPATPRFDPS
ncbi:Retrovirus-related Pol polyprotein from transposon TNT 1-94 [Sesbania bispinosa]|nr:Retrovirus-related Pol polyprotein from transposon TNT 1-94 [Sesbania bispinosa]